LSRWAYGSSSRRPRPPRKEPPMLTQVAEGVHVHQSDLLRNNTVVVQGDGGVLLVEGPGVLAAGDMLSDVFVPMLDNHRGDNDPVAEYLDGLETLAALADQIAVLVPGHGSPCGADE